MKKWLFDFLSFLAVSILFSGCEKDVKDEKPKVCEINFGIFDGTPNRNERNKGFRFIRYVHIDLKTDSILLKVNQNSVDFYEKGRKAPEFYAGKISESIKNQLVDFSDKVSKYKSGEHIDHTKYEGALYCGRSLYLECRNDTTFRYFYLIQDENSTLIQNVANNLFAISFRQKGLSKTNPVNFQNDDSLIVPIVNRKDFKPNSPPPPVEQTIKFTPPEENNP